MSELIAVPNISEGRDTATIDAVAAALNAQLLDIHSDPDHHRTVFTLAGDRGALAGAVLAGAREAVARIDLRRHQGEHPRVGVIDVAPIVYLDETERGAACAEALLLADRLGSELQLPVFLYGILAGGRTRAELRRGGGPALASRMDNGELTPDFGPRRIDPATGAVLVAARPPLIAFNIELAPPADVDRAKAIAAAIRDGSPDGLLGVRAIGLWLERTGTAQVSTNVEDHRATSLAEVLDAVARRASVRAAELVGLAPRAAFEGFPAGVEVRNKRLLEDALASARPPRPATGD